MRFAALVLHFIVILSAAAAGAAECRKVDSVCIDETAAKSISGISVTLAQVGGCWEYRDSYQCVGEKGDNTSNCASLDARQCTYVSDACTQYYGAPFENICERRTFTYSCPSADAHTITTNNCVARLGCTTNPDGTQNCIDSGYPADTDFGKAMVAMEVGREAGVYRNGAAVFSGVSKTCQSKNMGFSTECCDTSGGAMPNSSVLTSAALRNGLTIGGDVLAYEWKSGTSVMYDMMFQSDAPWMVDRAVAAWGQQGVMGWTPDPQFSTQISMGGFVLSYGQTASGIADTLASGLQTLTGATAPIPLPSMLQPVELIKNLGGIEGLSFSFDPVSFGFQMAIMVYQSLVACNEEEMKLGMMRGANLCISGGEDCDDGGLFGLLKSCTQFYCCYNSKLARIINQQGLPQLGRNPGRDCGGFGEGDLGVLNWDAIDMSEFVNDMVAQSKLPDAAAIQGRAPAVVEKVKNYYER